MCQKKFKIFFIANYKLSSKNWSNQISIFKQIYQAFFEKDLNLLKLHFYTNFENSWKFHTKWFSQSFVKFPEIQWVSINQNPKFYPDLNCLTSSSICVIPISHLTFYLFQLIKLAIVKNPAKFHLKLQTTFARILYHSYKIAYTKFRKWSRAIKIANKGNKV